MASHLTRHKQIGGAIAFPWRIKLRPSLGIRLGRCMGSRKFKISRGANIIARLTHQ
jgi:hypothetical protein